MIGRAIAGLAAAIGIGAAPLHAQPADEVTMAVTMQRLPAGFKGETYRSTGASVFAVHQGKGRVKLGEAEHALAPHDVFVAPAWVPYSFAADSDVELFSYSDRAGQEALGYWREQIG